MIESTHSKRLQVHTFSGPPIELGRQHGEALRPQVEQHLHGVLERLAKQAGWNPATCAVRALRYREAVRSTSPTLDEEIVGLAEGAAINLGHAYLLQLRAEVGTDAAREVGAGVHDREGAECTTFTLGAPQTAGLGPVIGGNADLPESYSGLLVGVRLQPTVGPPILMATPAGQISYVGMNGHGLAVFANTILCGGWCVGFPRYLLSRLVLAQKSVQRAQEIVTDVARAASRNLIMMDASGETRCLETTPELVGIHETQGGVGVHANHLVAPQTAHLEQGEADWMVDSRGRYERLRSLLTSSSPLSEKRIKAALRDRQNLPYALSREVAEDGSDFMTVFSTIAKPHSGELKIALGPPHLNKYHSFAVEA